MRVGPVLFAWRSVLLVLASWGIAAWERLIWVKGELPIPEWEWSDPYWWGPFSIMVAVATLIGPAFAVFMLLVAWGHAEEPK